MRTITIFQSLPARPARVFQALVDPTELSAWQADAVRGRVAPGRTLELSWPKLGVTLDLEVRDVIPERRVVFAHGAARLELEIVRGGVELRHTASFDEDTFAGTESSWRVALATLATYLARHRDRTRSVHWARVRARGNPELCHAYFTEARLLASWLGHSESNLGPTGSAVRLELSHGRRLRGPVIAHTAGRDVAFRWREMDDSVIVLRTLPTEDRALRSILVGWFRWSEPPEAAEVSRELDQALERLRRRLDGVAYA